tara:strand:+ start:25597 stop:26556 length:960 start_codon:yes stop_codon:yes gene_type:complete
MNPKKLEGLEIKISKHRVIVPVYIPNNEGYYKNAFDSLKLCLTSLILTIPKTSVITVINNNCTEEVSEYLQDLFCKRKIDQLVLNSTNKGKIEAVLDVFRNSKEDLITITDSDVLFKQGWFYETKKVFKTFPRVGYVSPLPLPSICNYYSKWSWFYGLTKSKIVREKHSDIESLKLFNKSILVEGEPSEIEKYPFKLKKENTTAVLGAGHFCGTYNKNIIDKIPYEFSGNTFTGAEKLFFDKPIEDAGFLRLATDEGWVFHIGVNPEDWMHDVVSYNVEKEVKDLEIEISSMGYSPNFISSLLMKTRLKKFRYKLVKKA